ncbi:Asp23/Gls24 family envelope stress response protein [Streptomyces albidoflavus]|uniref:Asp23/Gls24 family envelope stress response protein n=2 Tax=Streptomyces TaxID=1883 RepID=A0ABY3H027_9ACTN|nr:MULTISPECIES: Asp23/Gls24 family envelope stress response protein [Streptomyces]MYQ73476.1 Asp23/Gls24 family envelope stress response protein [Streptomyces sp. SID4934]MYW61740.1 Asp23/Gls24 family envelope stress response protein [Streptomyces sp. SID8370]MYW86700.1 Asp23/Gls24 family envelope stress response protein [Streptomyces sp. SID8371]MYX49070.1 Asp23/Gls24 family envelope stress response protein [Streptomyces sp. SID8385]MYX87007.1 Asp23/Gls24 family envelope stress response prot
MTPVTSGPVAPAERGETRIADRVVARIAGQAAREALRGNQRDADPPRATVSIHQDHARVRVSVELGYPTDIGRQCGAVRRRVTERVEGLTGMTVPEVAVQVEKLRVAGKQGRAR